MFKGKLFRKQNIEALEDEARRFQANGQYVEAAETYTRLASTYLNDNPLIYASYSHEAFMMWLKANNAEAALEQAHTLFRVLDDTGWLNRSMEQVLNIKLMIDEFKSAGYTNEADTLAGELNKKLEEFGLMLKPVSGAHYPSVCPSCGAQISNIESGGELKCSFCGLVISAT